MKIHILRDRATTLQIAEMLEELNRKTMIPETRRERYLTQSISTQLGGLAADPARIVSASKIPATRAVHDLLEESRAFSEWCAPALLPDRVDDASRLVDIQRGLTYWYWIWDTAKNNLDQREKLAMHAQAWSDEVLKMSGLLEQE